MRYVYARINKDTLRFVREQKAISFDYISRITKFPDSKISLWENAESGEFPTINQAKAIAKCYRIPFAGLYMNASDINVKHLPQMRNLRTLPDATIDNSALNLAIADILSARDLLIETKKELKESIPLFIFSINSSSDSVSQWAQEIRNGLGISSEIQYRCKSSRQLYLYIRDLVENAGVFIHAFSGIDTEVVRGFAIYMDELPIIGLNIKDRYPAKSFSIIHELVHLLKRSSAVCNEISGSFSTRAEEVFCNAVAGEVLVPRTELQKQIRDYSVTDIDLDVITSLATKFSVSKEVISRRMLDCRIITLPQFTYFMDMIRISFEQEREQERLRRKATGQSIPRNMVFEAIDQTSPSLCRTFYHGYREGYFDKQDISRYLGVKQTYISKLMMEVSKW